MSQIHNYRPRDSSYKNLISPEPSVFHITRDHNEGLPNIGLTCFLNSGIQLLYAAENFRKAMKRAIRGHIFIRSLAKVFADIQAKASNEEKEISLNAFIDELRKADSEYKMNTCEDATQFLMLILNQLENKSGNLITRFYIRYETSCKCPTAPAQFRQVYMPCKELTCVTCNHALVLTVIEPSEYLICLCSQETKVDTFKYYNDKKVKYQLLAVIIYDGNGRFGHYMSMRKIDGEFRVFDDNEIKEIRRWGRPLILLYQLQPEQILEKIEIFVAKTDEQIIKNEVKKPKIEQKEKEIEKVDQIFKGNTKIPYLSEVNQNPESNEAILRNQSVAKKTIQEKEITTKATTIKEDNIKNDKAKQTIQIDKNINKVKQAEDKFKNAIKSGQTIDRHPSLKDCQRENQKNQKQSTNKQQNNQWSYVYPTKKQVHLSKYLGKQLSAPFPSKQVILKKVNTNYYPYQIKSSDQPKKTSQQNNYQSAWQQQLIKSFNQNASKNKLHSNPTLNKRPQQIKEKSTSKYSNNHRLYRSIEVQKQQNKNKQIINTYHNAYKSPSKELNYTRNQQKNIKPQAQRRLGSPSPHSNQNKNNQNKRITSALSQSQRKAHYCINCGCITQHSVRNSDKGTCTCGRQFCWRCHLYWGINCHRTGKCLNKM